MTTRRDRPLWMWFALLNGVGLLAIAVAVFFALRPRDQQRVVEGLQRASQQPDVSEHSPSSPLPKENSSKPNSDTTTKNEAASTPPVLSVADVIDRVDRGVVLVRTRNQKGDEIGFGSGFVIDSNGLIATNFHVLRGASKAEAVFADETTIEVKGCRAWEADGDLAILELVSVPKDVEILSLRQDTDRRNASDVVAIGHPQGFRYTTSTGIISGIHKTTDLPPAYRQVITASDESVWIQTNAAISGGSSGGPLLDLTGQVVGINTWIANGENLGFAVDVRHLAALRKQLREKSLSLADLTGPEERLQSLVNEFNTQRSYLIQDVSQISSVDTAKKKLAERHPALDYMPKMYELADRYRGLPVARLALHTACEMAGLPDCPTACNETLKPVANRVVDDYAADPRLVGTMLAMRGSRLEEAWALLRRLGEQSPHQQVQGAAWYSLANALQFVSQTDRTEETAEEKGRQRQEALAVFDRIQSEFAKVKIGNQELGEVAEQQGYQLRHLCVGCIPPEIVGRDADGIEFRLSDYRGKVVVVDFWADWCPHCVQMYPLERKLVKRHVSKPFALLGVNSDEPSRLKRVIESEAVTWRNWSDGPEGDINKSWRIESLPSLYVLDHEGVIRYKNVRDKELEKSIDALLKKVPSERKDAAQEETQGTETTDGTR